MILDKIADFTTEVLNYDTTKVIIGRENATQKTFSDNYIVVDTLIPASVVCSNRDYDSENELETFNTFFSTKITLEFYGNEAYANAYKFVNIQNSQLARDLQKHYRVTIYKDILINNLKQVVGNRYFDRYELEIVVKYWEVLDIDTLRIENVSIDYIKEN